jgi:predicted RNA-binding Zn-ribbon protein involved in translation (DUF1610 family)
MGEIKFICPSCGQHIECDQSYAGEHFPCPGCATQIRVPEFTHPAAANPLPVFNPPSAEKVTYQSTKHSESDGSENENIPAAEQNVVRESEQATVSREKETREAHDEDLGKEFVFACPHCKSELRLRAEIQAVKAKEEKAFEKPTAKIDSGSTADREKQIAAARIAQAVHVYPPMKPRLDYVLRESGEKKNEAPEDEIKTVHE